MRRVTIVVPCFNESKRLDEAALLAFCSRNPGIGFLLVDDGSTDDTWALVERIASRSEAIEGLRLAVNGGKAEAVRQGIVDALNRFSSHYVGFWDADLATPLSAIPEFVRVLDERPSVQAVLGARVQLLGRDIRRRSWRHYSGRVFATAASITLNVPVYDTQCGAKMFRGDELTREAFAAPFRSRWVFDVELLARIAQRGGGANFLLSCVYELPLHVWHDVKGSKLRPKDYLRAMFDLARINRRYRLRRRPASPRLLPRDTAVILEQRT